ncbi:MAG TPA: DUF951 domain-containing protein [Clostridiaceae bacterium]|nr:DUF951 domain-containing protein [Clostridiaceae bacterium]
MADKFSIGDVVELKKQHPCGSKQWEITRTGADFRIKCLGCSHQVMLPRPKFEKSVKKIIKSNISGQSNV